MIFLESGTQLTSDLHGIGKHQTKRAGFLLISDNLQETVEIVDIIPSIESDHSCILMKLRAVNESTRRRADWKFNSSVTQGARFVDMLIKENSYFKKAVAHSSSTYRSDCTMGIS